MRGHVSVLAAASRRLQVSGSAKNALVLVTWDQNIQGEGRMNVSSFSRFVLGAAVVLSAVTAFSPRFGSLAVAVSLFSVPLAMWSWMRLRVSPARAATRAISPTGDPRFAAPQSAELDAPTDPAPAFALACMLIGIGVCWRLATRVSFESVDSLPLIGVIAGALGTAWMLRLGLCDRRTALPAFAGLALTAAAAAGWLDVAVDREPPLRSLVAVTRRDVTRFEWLARHELELGVGTTRSDWRRVVVDVSDRRHLFLGSTACLEEHDGLFGQRWAAVHPCATDAELTGEVAARRWIERNQRALGDFPALTQRVLAGHWREVDRELNDLQQRFAAGQVTDVEVDQAFDAFYIASPLLDSPLKDWMTAAPRSPAAQIAAAEHARAQFDVLSHGGFSADVSPGFNAEAQRAVALRRLDDADALMSKPSSIDVLLRYRMTAASPEAMNHWLDRALAANADDLLMRREYLLWHPLCPCRGGTSDDAAMRHVLAAPTSSRVKEGLDAVRMYERAVDADGSDGAANLYRQMLTLHATPQDRYTANINLAVYLATHGDKSSALEHLDAAIAILPGNTHAHAVRAWVHEQMGQYAEAIADDLVDARRKDLDAQHAAGRILLWGKPGVPADVAEAARWIAEASYLGESEARGLLRSRADLLALVAKQPVRALSEGQASASVFLPAPSADAGRPGVDRRGGFEIARQASGSGSLN
jgi:tetratricopeptide (TPR) repeat protein